MKKSYASKKGSCISFLTGSCKDDASLEIMRISLKKETDRRQKLEKLLQKYDDIHTLERGHVRTLKASIIELKDVAPISKIKFLVDPNIYVDNNLSIETREFLCMLLNTFYQRYSENQEYDKQASTNNQEIKELLKAGSNSEELLFKIQKSNINSQVQLEGELLSEKANLKELVQKGKQFTNEENRVRAIWEERKLKYDIQKQKVDELTQMMLDLQSKVIGLTQKIHQGEEIKQQNQDKISGEMAYQAKFQEEVQRLKEDITYQYKRQIKLKKKIQAKKYKLDKLKGHTNYDNSKHEANIKILYMHEPRKSTKYQDIGEVLDIERTFQKAMNRSVSSNLFTVNTSS